MVAVRIAHPQVLNDLAAQVRRGDVGEARRQSSSSTLSGINRARATSIAAGCNITAGHGRWGQLALLGAERTRPRRPCCNHGCTAFCHRVRRVIDPTRRRCTKGACHGDRIWSALLFSSPSMIFTVVRRRRGGRMIVKASTGLRVASTRPASWLARPPRSMAVT